jgi:hypothetical protein
LLFYIVFVVFSSFLLRYLCYIRLLFVFCAFFLYLKHKE